MASVRPASFYCLLVVVCFAVSASAAQTNISAAVGDSVTLPCKASNNSIRVMWWSRPDQEPKYVLMYRDEQFDPEEQHPSFKNRVDLQDRQMKDGDVSLILKNVMIIDSGTYECHVFMGGPKQTKRAADYISVINLSVFPAQKSTTAGQTVTLPCQAPNNSNPNTVVEWSRDDLEPLYVLKYHHNHTELSPPFMNRVELQDSPMKDGNVSLILKDVKISDAGTYKCRVSVGGTNRRKRSIVETDPISIINLSVAPPPGQPGGSFAVVAGLLVSGTLVLVVGGVVFLLLFKKYKDQKR